MTGWSMLPLAELTTADMLSFEEKLQGQQQFMLWLYGPVFLIGLILLIGFTLYQRQRPIDWSWSLHRLERRPWTWPAAAWVVFPLMAAQVVFHLALILFGVEVDVESGGEGATLLLILQSLVFHWLCFVLIAAGLWVRRTSWNAAFGIDGPGLFPDMVAGVLVMLGVMPLVIGYNVVAGMVMEWMDYTPRVQEVTRIIAEPGHGFTSAYLVGLAVVVAPVVEELLFRGILLPAIARLSGVKPAIVIVSLLFALVHGAYLPQFGIFFILSVAFCLAYLHRGSIVTPIAMHALFNGLTVAVIMRL